MDSSEAGITVAESEYTEGVDSNQISKGYSMPGVTQGQ